MNMFTLSYRLLAHKPLNAYLNVLMLALGISAIIFLFHINQQTSEKFDQQIKGIDLVIGAKGSPMQIMLSSVFHADNPTGNITLWEAEKLAANRLIKKAIPLALGDSYKGFRIVGTETAYFDFFNLSLKSGHLFDQPFDAVIGHELQQLLQLKLGNRFVSQHGLGELAHEHDDHYFVVKGILQPTGLIYDRLIFTSVQSIWDAHDEHEHTDAHDHDNEDNHASVHEDHEHQTEEHHHYSKLIPALPLDHIDSSLQITAMLMQYANPMAAVQLPRQINAAGNLMAASPAYEISRMQNILGSGTQLLMYFGYALLLLAGLSIFISQWNRMNEQLIDLAIIRILGKQLAKTISIWVIQAFYISFIGCLLALLIAHFGLFIFNQLTPTGLGLQFDLFKIAEGEVEIILLAMLLCQLAVLPPLIKSHIKTPISIIKNNQ